ncbi:uncharacterized protein [Linepithema humile]|uniref:uncharacterized protein n=1 Tax=Linepithema humile TaxID=83485 RepID=UPI00351EE17D
MLDLALLVTAFARQYLLSLSGMKGNVTNHGCVPISSHSVQYPVAAILLDTALEKRSQITGLASGYLRRNTFQYILNLIRPVLEKVPDNPGRDPISACRQLYIALWMLAAPDSYRSVCTKFDVGRATAWRCVLRVTKALYRLRNTFISWPTRAQAEQTWTKMEQRYGFPGVIGAVDGTLIKISAPARNPEAYICRKNYHAIQLQVVCDADLRFIHCYAGQPGSVHDMRTFMYSGLQQKCNPQFFPEDSHLLGDAAYTIQRNVMVPYRDNGHLTEAETNFNKKLSSARMIVERSLGLLKGRWRCLLDKLSMTRTDLIPRYIIGCCVLHNLCLLRNDEIDIPILVENRYMLQELHPLDVNVNDRNEGIVKRENLTRLLN